MASVNWKPQPKAEEGRPAVRPVAVVTPVDINGKPLPPPQTDMERIFDEVWPEIEVTIKALRDQ